MKLIPAIVLAALLGARGFADDLEAKAKPSIEKLSSDEAEVREAGTRELMRLGKEARAVLERAMAATDDPEVRFRLKRVLSSFDGPDWATDLAAAEKAAKAGGKALLVVAGDGPREEGRTGDGNLLRQSVADPELAKFLGEKFVLVWSEARFAGASVTMRGLGDDSPEGSGTVRIFFCTADGNVRHALQGWWSPERLRAEAEGALELTADIDVPTARKHREERRTKMRDDLTKSLRNVGGDKASLMRAVEAYRMMEMSYVSTDTQIGTDVGACLEPAGNRDPRPK